MSIVTSKPFLTSRTAKTILTDSKFVSSHQEEEKEEDLFGNIPEDFSIDDELCNQMFPSKNTIMPLSNVSPQIRSLRNAYHRSLTQVNDDNTLPKNDILPKKEDPSKEYHGSKKTTGTTVGTTFGQTFAEEDQNEVVNAESLVKTITIKIPTMGQGNKNRSTVYNVVLAEDENENQDEKELYERQ